MKSSNITLILFLWGMFQIGIIDNLFAQQPSIGFFRPYDKDGIHVFETTKADTVPFEGLKLRWGANFTQQFQSLSHSNTAERVLDAEGKDANELIELGSGFNLATANLNLDAQLSDGIRVSLVTYLSSRHHPEAWVKGGYVQVDKLPMLNSALIDHIMQYVTIRAGHFEINYGDAHFRRSDNGNALYNPFVGNYIMDAFTTEIGGEVYFQHKGWLAMAAMTGGEIQGSIVRPNERAPSFYGKLGYDSQINDELRLRLTGSMYTTSKSLNNTLYGGDRAGSRYYLVMEPTTASAGSNFTSGLFNPGFRSKVTAMMINPFIKYQGLELFGTYETATGSAANETTDRTWNQWAIDAVYRFLAEENLYVAARYNVASGQLVSGEDASINRMQAGLGWFLTDNILLKGEYVSQQYQDFPQEDIRNGGKFNGFIIEGVIGF